MTSRRDWCRAAVLGVLGAGMRARAASSAPAKRPLVAAHRGGALLWPENSLTAFRNALGLGVDFLETDVHLTSDGEVVIVHDATLDRTTTGSGPVRAAALGDLARLRLRGADGAPTGDGVPTLGTVLDLMPGHRTELLLEIKVGADGQRYPGIEEKALALVKARGLLARTLVMGFHAPTVRRIRELEPATRTVLLVGRARIDRQGASFADAVRWTVDAGANVVGIQHTALDASVVSAARAAGLRVAAWTVNEEPDLRRAVELGVDVVISDRPDLALRLAR
ncbi:MAG: glycerophosphodiester phosphodiesterase [Candidatus Rokubacteria bacterium]|nr:glycerophosphodiester phosphodiesterase [Candidatus Rokubacteria bacterium]